ncbi:MAG TPA: glucosamine-6-phosphate deaminase [Acholeplasma sp.]|jgi:glucosamine-6-phosphate deaminase|nr:glucosamine-6-phosphate deaminase [Acholeplasmatales bacterium]HHV33645.1 glucosamine-6-phosphate deaminase [Acholeplasma sp.]
MKIIINKKAKLDKLAAQEIINLVNENPKAVLGLATGSSPIGLYEELIKDHKANKTNYKKVTTFNLDEYIGIPIDHEQSYHTFMYETLFKHLNINLKNTNFPKQDDPASYTKLLEKKPVDLQILGIGSNGHIAFNEPGTSFDSTTQYVDLAESTIKDNSRFFDSIDDVPKRAVTMGLKDIMMAKKVILLAFGKNKAEAINTLVNGKKSEDCPATILQDHPNLTLYLDEDAASLLKK